MSVSSVADFLVASAEITIKKTKEKNILIELRSHTCFSFIMQCFAMMIQSIRYTSYILNFLVVCLITVKSEAPILVASSFSIGL
jgi:hypothetical protein